MVLQDDELPGFALVSVNASLPAATTPAARYRFALPEPCGSYGVSVGRTVDFAALELVRRPLAGVGDDVLHVVARSEPESAQQLLPVFERAVISEAPLDDPILDGVVAIELELEVLEEPSVPAPPSPSLRPHGRYRLCTSPDCSGAEFLDLALVTELPPEPELEICGFAAASFAPPPDAGHIDSGPPLGSSVLAVPEPRSGLAPAAALLASLGLARRQRRGAGDRREARRRVPERRL